MGLRTSQTRNCATSLGSSVQGGSGDNLRREASLLSGGAKFSALFVTGNDFRRHPQHLKTDIKRRPRKHYEHNGDVQYTFEGI